MPDIATPIAIAVVRHAGRVLIGRRPPGVPLAGLWEFPGGKLLADETPPAAAVRECREETGLDVTAGEMLARVQHDYPHGRVALHFIDCVPANAGQTPQAGYRWVEQGALATYEFPAANAEIVARLVRDAMR